MAVCVNIVSSSDRFMLWIRHTLLVAYRNGLGTKLVSCPDPPRTFRFSGRGLVARLDNL